jgi:hypothetical protein
MHKTYFAWVRFGGHYTAQKWHGERLTGHGTLKYGSPSPESSLAFLVELQGEESSYGLDQLKELYPVEKVIK